MDYMIFYRVYMIFGMDNMIFYRVYMIFGMDYMIFYRVYMIFGMDYMIFYRVYMIFGMDYMIFYRAYMVFGMDYMIFYRAYMIFGEISYSNGWRKDVVNQCLEFGVGTETKPATMALCWTLLRKREPSFTVMIASTMLHPYLQSSVNLTDFGHVSV